MLLSRFICFIPKGTPYSINSNSLCYAFLVRVHKEVSFTFGDFGLFPVSEE